jgi:RNA polymerase-binding protein DksA
MTRSQIIENIKSHFITERERLVQPSSHEGWLSEPEVDSADELDYTVAVRERQMALRLKGREAAYACKIQDALARIEAGTFGLCEQCEEEIDSKRLEARPTATKCFLCKESEEREEQAYGHMTRRSRLVSVA